VIQGDSSRRTTFQFWEGRGRSSFGTCGGFEPFFELGAFSLILLRVFTRAELFLFQGEISLLVIIYRAACYLAWAVFLLYCVWEVVSLLAAAYTIPWRHISRPQRHSTILQGVRGAAKAVEGSFSHWACSFPAGRFTSATRMTISGRVFL